MNRFLDEVAIILGAKPALSETDRQIIETMIDIGAEQNEIAETFGYAPEQIEAVAEDHAAPSADAGNSADDLGLPTVKVTLPRP